MDALPKATGKKTEGRRQTRKYFSGLAYKEESLGGFDKSKREKNFHG